METVWTTLTVEDLNDYLAQGQLRALQTQALAEGQTDPVVQLIADTTHYVRAHIAAYPLNRLAKSPGTIPPEMKAHTAAIVIECAQARLPGLELTPLQQRRAKDARELLVSIAQGFLPVSAPSEAGGETAYARSGGATSIEGKRGSNEQFTRRKLRSL